MLFNPAGNGDCQFAAVAWSLCSSGIQCSEESLRKEVVEYLTQNPFGNDRFPLELFAGLPWLEYLTLMSENRVYRDHITLQAIANIHNVELIVISSLGPDAQTVISPQHSTPIVSLTLGHFAEDHGAHYVCLTMLLSHNDNNSDSDNKQEKDKQEKDNQENNKQENDKQENDKPEKAKKEKDKQEKDKVNADEVIQTNSSLIMSLLNEVLNCIVNLSLTGNKRSIIQTFHTLRCLNSRHRALAAPYIHQLPQVSYDQDILVSDWHSIHKICRVHRKATWFWPGKDIINCP